MNLSEKLLAERSAVTQFSLDRRRQWIASLLLTFTINAPHQPDGPLNSSNDNRYLTVFFASWPDGDLKVMAEHD